MLRAASLILFLSIAAPLLAQSTHASAALTLPDANLMEAAPEAPSYFHFTHPRPILTDGQLWEGNDYPETIRILERNQDGFRYWGWYGLLYGSGMGLARSNDLVHWTKYGENPLWRDARWPSVMANVDPKHPRRLYFAITRGYNTPGSYIVLATSDDGIHVTQQKILVAKTPNQRNQNPNLFRDPHNGRYYLTFYRGNDIDHYEIVSRNAARLEDLDKAPDKILLESRTTLAAPNLFFYDGVYYLGTEIWTPEPGDPVGLWQTRMFYADSPDGDFKPIRNPVLPGVSACFDQYIFDGRFYGYSCLDITLTQGHIEEVEAPLR